MSSIIEASIETFCPNAFKIFEVLMSSRSSDNYHNKCERKLRNFKLFQTKEEEMKIETSDSQTSFVSPEYQEVYAPMTGLSHEYVSLVRLIKVLSLRSW